MDTNTPMTGTAVFLLIFTGALAVLAVCIVYMIVSLVRRGDERRTYILRKTCTTTFLIWACMLMIEVIYSLITGGRADFTVERSAFLELGVVAAVFTVNLFINKRRYGN